MVIERTYIIPLRAGYRNTPKYCRTNKAVKVLRAFLARHMRVKDEQIKLGQHLNMFLWDHGIKNPPARVTVNVVKNDEGFVTAELNDAKYTETVKPDSKTDEPQGLKEKIQAAVGGKKTDSKDAKVKTEKTDAKATEAEADKEEAADEKAKSEKPKVSKKASKPLHPPQ